MSIATELQDLNDNILDAYTAVQTKGGTVPANKNMDNLDDAITSIPSGGGRWAYDIHTKRSTSDQAEFVRDYDDTPPTISTPFLPATITKIGEGALIYAYRYFPHVTPEVRIGINLDSITSIGTGGMYYAFAPDQIPGQFTSSSKIKDVSFRNLTTVGSYGLTHAFAYSQMESLDFTNLETVGTNSLQEFSRRTYGVLDEANFPALTSVDTYSFHRAFYDPVNSQSGVKKASFPSLVHADKAQAFAECFRGNKILQTVDFSALKTVGQNATGLSYADSTFYYAFEGCTSLTSVDFSSLESIYASSTNGRQFSYAFSGCTGLTSIDLSSLTSVTGSYSFNKAFYGCTSLVSADFRALTSIGSYAFSYIFQNCSSLTSVRFDALADLTTSRIFNYAFQNCTSLTSLSFPSLTTSSFSSYTNQFERMLSGCSNVTVHFPAAIQSTIGNWGDVTNGFGGTNTTVLFDL